MCNRWSVVAAPYLPDSAPSNHLPSFVAYEPLLACFPIALEPSTGLPTPAAIQTALKDVGQNPALALALLNQAPIAGAARLGLALLN
jgi:hypothetical protein